MSKGQLTVRRILLYCCAAGLFGVVVMVVGVTALAGIDAWYNLAQGRIALLFFLAFLFPFVGTLFWMSLAWFQERDSL